LDGNEACHLTAGAVARGEPTVADGVGPQR
jgi:hypothetical protein